MKAALLFSIALAGTQSYAQTYPSTIAVHLYDTPEAASYDFDRSYDSTQQNRQILIPVVSRYAPSSIGRDDTSWAVVYTPNNYDSSCAVTAAGVDSPETWTGSSICGGGLFNWNASTFTSSAAAKAFYDGTLDSTQRLTAVIYRVPGSLHPFNRNYVVFYQNPGTFCF